MKLVHSSYSRQRLEITGAFVITGPQAVEPSGNGAPQWVFDAFDQDPAIELIAINHTHGPHGGGVVYRRMQDKEVQR